MDLPAAIGRETEFPGQLGESGPGMAEEVLHRPSTILLIYEPDVERLKEIALTLEGARALPDGSRRRLVFAPTKYLDRDFLHQFRIDFQQLPFQIYEAIDRLEA